MPEDLKDEPAGAPAPARVVRRRRKRAPSNGAGNEADKQEGSAGAVAPPADAPVAAEPAPPDPSPDGAAPARRPRRRRNGRAGGAVAEGDGQAAAEPAADRLPAKAQQRRQPRKRPRVSRRPPPGPVAKSGEMSMLITVSGDRSQVALMDGRELIQHLVTHAEDRSIAGNIYLGRVQNVLPGMEAAFLDIGEDKNAILYAGEVSFDEEIEGPAPRIEAILKSGQAVLAQVTKDPIGSKGARLTTEVSVAGRYLVLVPGAGSLGISRRLPDAERRRLRELALRIRPEGHGLIVRTAAEGVSEADLTRDIERLVRIWKEIDRKRQRVKPPKLIHSEPNLVIRAVRDLFTADVTKVVVEDRAIYDELKEYIEEVTPSLSERLELYEQQPPLFEKHQVTEQLRKAVDRKVWLKSGGHIVIDRAEALTVVDVNTGRFVGKSNLEQTVLQTNLEAAREIAKQLRLRDIGGIIVIDFIDMAIQRNRGEVVRVFNDALARDRTRTQVFGISDLGLLQMTRKRVSEGLLEAFSEMCPNCEGRGIILADLDAPGAAVPAAAEQPAPGPVEQPPAGRVDETVAGAEEEQPPPGPADEATAGPAADQPPSGEDEPRVEMASGEQAPPAEGEEMPPGEGEQG